MEERKQIFKSNLFWLILILLNFCCSIVISAYVKNTTASILIAQAAILVPVIVYLLFNKQNPLELLRFRKFHLGSAFLVILLTACMYPIIMVINTLSMMFATNFTADTMMDITGYGLPVSLLIMAALPAFVEECTFRGILLGTYDKGKRPVRAIIFSSLAFAMMHMNLNQMCYAFFMGLMMGIVVEITGSIWSSMLMHFCVNGFSTTMSWMFTKLQTQDNGGLTESLDAAAANTPEELLNTALVILPFALIAAGICVLLIKAIASLNGRSEQLHFWTAKEYKEDRAEIQKIRMIDVPYCVSVFLCLMIAVINEILIRIIL